MSPCTIAAAVPMMHATVPMIHTTVPMMHTTVPMMHATVPMIHTTVPMMHAAPQSCCYRMDMDSKMQQPVDPECNVLCYVLEGSARFGSQQLSVPAGSAVTLQRDGDSVAIVAEHAGCDFLLAAARPHGESIHLSTTDKLTFHSRRHDHAARTIRDGRPNAAARGS